MIPTLAILEFTDFALIAFIVIVFASSASLFARQNSKLLRIERKVDALLDHFQIVPPSKLSAEVQRLAGDPKQKKAAIMLHQEQTGVSLSDATAAIEEFVGE